MNFVNEKSTENGKTEDFIPMNAAPPTPAPLSSGLITGGKHSLARLETAMWWLEIDEVEVFDLIADRALVAFNLARPGVERRLPGIWSRSLLEYSPLASRSEVHCSEFQTYPPARTACGASEVCDGIEHSTAEVLSDLLPSGGRDLRFGEVLFALGIKRRLLHVLVEAALLAAVPGTGDRVSRAPLITRASVVEFLTRRRM
jgi:hypothetical protein